MTSRLTPPSQPSKPPVRHEVPGKAGAISLRRAKGPGTENATTSTPYLVTVLGRISGLTGTLNLGEMSTFELISFIHSFVFVIISVAVPEWTNRLISLNLDKNIYFFTLFLVPYLPYFCTNKDCNI